MNQWKDIPGYGGAYQVSRWGEVRSWRLHGTKRRADEPKLLTQIRRHRGGGRSIFYAVRLTDESGKSSHVKVMSLVVDLWMGGCPKGKVPYHKNGDLTDSCEHNIGFATRHELGKKTGGIAQRKAVVKIDPNGEEIEIYPSAAAAARANFVSSQTMRNRCAGKGKDFDGCKYVYEERRKKHGEGSACMPV